MLPADPTPRGSAAGPAIRRHGPPELAARRAVGPRTSRQRARRWCAPGRRGAPGAHDGAVGRCGGGRSSRSSATSRGRGADGASLAETGSRRVRRRRRTGGCAWRGGRRRAGLRRRGRACGWRGPCREPRRAGRAGCRVSVHLRLVTGVPHLVWGLMPPAHGLHETGPTIYRGRPMVLSIRRSLVERDGAVSLHTHLGLRCRERRPTSTTGAPSPDRVDAKAARCTAPDVDILHRPPARRASRSRRADERTPGEGAGRATMRQIGTAARGTTRAGIPTPRRACSRPATPRP